MVLIERQCSAEAKTLFGLTQCEPRKAPSLTEPGAAFEMATQLAAAGVMPLRTAPRSERSDAAALNEAAEIELCMPRRVSDAPRTVTLRLRQ